MRLKSFGVILTTLFFISLVLAESNTGCCSLNQKGEKCATSLQSACSGSFALGADCSATSFCVKGCCYDEQKGIYDKNVIRSDCSKSWSPDYTCNLPGAEKGCCVLDKTTVFETEGQCKTDTQALSSLSQPDFRKISELECMALSNVQKQGACVVGKTCSFITEVNCLKLGGKFHESYLCTAEQLDTECEKTTTTTCVEGKDGVYFVDSCGNIANIYDSSKINDMAYWNKVVSEEKSCGSGSGSANSKSCGNCDRLAGGICASSDEDNFKVNSGAFYCRPTSCVFKGETYNNGESWCVYDDVVGNGSDTAGSRHWRYVCTYGEIQIEPCADFRNEVCVQSGNLTMNESSIDFRTASCVDNGWRECIDYNSLEDLGQMKEKCSGNPMCVLKNINVDSYFQFDYCAPSYPPGFLIKEEDPEKNGEEVCKTANQKCTVVYVKNALWKWECKKNCNCLTQNFAQEMNDFCTNLGDCGADVNYLDDLTDDGYSVKGAPKLGSAYLKSKQNVNIKKEIYNAVFDSITLPYIFYMKDSFVSSKKYVGYPVTIINLDSLARRAKKDAEKEYEHSAEYWLIGGPVAEWFGIGDTKKKTVEFKCLPWQPPVGGEKCEECNGDPLKPCSEYKCSSIGAACKLINKGTGEETCIYEDPKDVAPPILNPFYGYISTTEKYADITFSGFRISSIEENCVEAYAKLKFGISTNEPAQCKFDIENRNFTNMEYDLGSNFIYNHTAIFSVPDPSHGQSQGLDWKGQMKLYVKCRDVHDNFNPTEYTIDICVNEGPDKTAPRIRAIIPNDALVGFNTTEKKVQVITNELSTCRWDLSDKEYSSMENGMLCDDDLEVQSSTEGYVCESVLPITSSENTFFARCKDQPWLNGTGNENTVSTPIVLRKPSMPIQIDWIEPSENFESATEFALVNLQVATSGGGNVHVCSYSLSGFENMIEMFETRSTVHKQPLNLESGQNNIFIECTDETGDRTRTQVDLEIKYDGSSPQISRIWRDNSSIYFKTTENAICGFSEKDCNFIIANSSAKMQHSEKLLPGKTYYIRCKDEFGNAPAGCSVMISSV